MGRTYFLLHILSESLITVFKFPEQSAIVEPKPDIGTLFATLYKPVAEMRIASDSLQKGIAGM